MNKCKKVAFQLVVNGKNYMPSREEWDSTLRKLPQCEEEEFQIEDDRLCVHILPDFPYAQWSVRIFRSQGVYVLSMGSEEPLDSVVENFRRSLFCPPGAEIRVQWIGAFSGMFTHSLNAEPLLEWYLHHVEETWTDIGCWVFDLASAVCGHNWHWNKNGGNKAAEMLAAAVAKMPLGQMYDEREVERLVDLKTFNRFYGQLSDKLRSNFNHGYSPYPGGCRIEIRQFAAIWSLMANLRLGE